MAEQGGPSGVNVESLMKHQRDTALASLSKTSELLGKALVVADKALALAKEYEGKYLEMAGLAYVPGTWACPQCGFVLIQRTLDVSSGNIVVNPSGTAEKCPNDGHEMFRVTERQQRKEAEEACLRLIEQNENHKTDGSKHGSKEDSPTAKGEVVDFVIPAKAEKEKRQQKVIDLSSHRPVSVTRPKHLPSAAETPPDRSTRVTVHHFHDAAIQRNKKTDEPGD